MGQLEEEEGFEPSVPCGTPDFESGTFGHSATSPWDELYQRRRPGFRTGEAIYVAILSLL